MVLLSCPNKLVTATLFASALASVALFGIYRSITKAKPGGKKNSPYKIRNELLPIGFVYSVFKECVGTPRQGHLAPNTRAIIKISLPSISNHAFEGLEEYSHLWVVFLFHLNNNTDKRAPLRTKGYKFPSKISPPALEGKKIGVFASRSPHRPNPVGFTLCKLEKVEVMGSKKHKRIWLFISSHDLVDGTPVIDIKPYIQFYDSIKDGLTHTPKWVSNAYNQRRDVTFSEEATNQLRTAVTLGYLEHYKAGEFDIVQACIKSILETDMRSPYKLLQASKGVSTICFDTLKISYTAGYSSNYSNDISTLITQVETA